MIEAIKNWALSICIASLVCGIMVSLSPNGNIEKGIKLVASLFFLLVVITPLLTGKLSFSGEEINKILKNDFSSSQKSNTSKLNEEAINIAKEEIKNQIATLLTQEKVRFSNISVDISAENNTFVLKKVLVKADKEHLNSIKNILMSKLNIKENIIFFKGEE